MAAVWEQSKTEGGDLLVLLALADFANGNGVAWPSVQTLADKARKTKRQTQRILKRLVKNREIEMVPNQGTNGTNVYRFVRGVTFEARGGDISGQNGVTFRVNSEPKMSPNPSVEPKNEPKDSGAPAPGHRDFVQGWGERYQKKFGRAYVFQGGKDASAVKRLLKATGKSADLLLAEVERAWGSAGFNCKQAVSISGFVSRYNEIQAELVSPLPPGVRRGTRPPLAGPAGLDRADLKRRMDEGDKAQREKLRPQVEAECKRLGIPYDL